MSNLPYHQIFLAKMSRIMIASSVKNILQSNRGAFRVFPKASFASKPETEFEKDAALMQAFHACATANSDGKIHMDNAEQMVRKIKEMSSPGLEYTQGRKHIVAYARTAYQWQDGADKAFKESIRNWATERKAAKKLAAAPKV